MLPMLANNNTVHHTTNISLIIPINADCKICLVEGIIIGTSEGIYEDEYGMNEIILINGALDTWSNTLNTIDSF